MNITKSPFNYIGNKYRIITDIQRFFPKKISTMVDLFCGGCDVIINTTATKKIANDINYHIIDIFKCFQENPDTIIEQIEGIIEKWNLSKENEQAYLKFRNHYNKKGTPIELYTLMCYSYNYQFRFNSKHEFNNPFGRNRSSFNETIKSNLEEFLKRISDISFSSEEFDRLDLSFLKPGDFVYADPPYLLTCGSYNDGKRGFKGWSEEDDEILFQLLSDLDSKGIKFALSNVIEHKGEKHIRMQKWKSDNKYHMHKIDFNYDNCSYHTNNKKNITKEILITNY